MCTPEYKNKNIQESIKKTSDNEINIPVNSTRVTTDKSNQSQMAPKSTLKSLGNLDKVKTVNIPKTGENKDTFVDTGSEETFFINTDKNEDSIINTNKETFVTEQKEETFGSAPLFGIANRTVVENQQKLLKGQMQPQNLPGEIIIQIEEQEQEQLGDQTKEKQQQDQAMQQEQDEFGTMENLSQLRERLHAMAEPGVDSGRFTAMVNAVDSAFNKLSILKEKTNKISALVDIRAALDIYYQKNKGIKFSRKGRTRRDFVASWLQRIDQNIARYSEENPGFNDTKLSDRNKIRAHQRAVDNAELLPQTKKDIVAMGRKFTSTINKVGDIENDRDREAFGNIRERVLTLSRKLADPGFDIRKESTYIRDLVKLSNDLSKYRQLDLGNKAFAGAESMTKAINKLILNAPEFVQNAFVHNAESFGEDGFFEDELNRNLMMDLGKARMKRNLEAMGYKDSKGKLLTGEKYVTEFSIRHMVAKERFSKMYETGIGICPTEELEAKIKEIKANPRAQDKHDGVVITPDERLRAYLFGDIGMEEDGTVRSTSRLSQIQRYKNAWMDNNFEGMVPMLDEFLDKLMKRAYTTKDISTKSLRQHYGDMVETTGFAAQIENLFENNGRIGKKYVDMLPDISKRKVSGIATYRMILENFINRFSSTMGLRQLNSGTDIDSIMVKKTELLGLKGGDVSGEYESLVKYCLRNPKRAKKELYFDVDYEENKVIYLEEETENQSNPQYDNLLSQGYKYIIGPDMNMVASDIIASKLNEKPKEIPTTKDLTKFMGMSYWRFRPTEYLFENKTSAEFDNMLLNKDLINKDKLGYIKRDEDRIRNIDKNHVYRVTESGFDTRYNLVEFGNYADSIVTREVMEKYKDQGWKFNRTKYTDKQAEANLKNLLKYVKLNENGEALLEYKEAHEWNLKFIGNLSIVKTGTIFMDTFQREWLAEDDNFGHISDVYLSNIDLAKELIKTKDKKWFVENAGQMQSMVRLWDNLLDSYIKTNHFDGLHRVKFDDKDKYDKLMGSGKEVKSLISQIKNLYAAIGVDIVTGEYVSEESINSLMNNKQGLGDLKDKMEAFFAEPGEEIQSDVEIEIEVESAAQRELLRQKQQQIDEKTRELNELKERENTLNGEYEQAEENLKQVKEETKGQRYDFERRIQTLSARISEISPQKAKLSEQIDFINSNESEQSKAMAGLDDENHPINKTIKTLETMDRISEEAMEEYERDGVHTYEDYLDEVQKDILDYKADPVTLTKRDLWKEQLNYYVNSFSVGYEAKEKDHAKKQNEFTERIKDTQEKIKLSQDKTYTDKLNDDYKNIKDRIGSNVVTRKQTDFINNFKTIKTNLLSTLITGQTAAEYLHNYDTGSRKVWKEAESLYREYYQEYAGSIQTTIEMEKQRYLTMVSEHNKKADLYNQALEEKVRKSLGINNPYDPIPDYVTLNRMEKMVESQDMLSEFNYEIPTVESILKKKTRDVYIREYQSAQGSVQQNRQDDYDMDSYEKDLDRLNSDEFSLINYGGASTLEKLKENLISQQEEDNTEWKETQETRDSLYSNLKIARVEYNKQRIKDLREYAKNNLRFAEKKLLDEKDKARRVREKAVEEIQSQIDLLDGEMNTYRNGIKDLEEKILDLGKTRELMQKKSDILDSLHGLKESIEGKQKEIDDLK